MRKLITFIIGIFAGAGVGIAGVALFVPETSAEIRARLRAGFQESLAHAREASARKRAELEAELSFLSRMSGDHRGDRI